MFEFSQSQRMVRESIEEFAKKELPPSLVRELDEADVFPKDLFLRMASLGVSGVTIPEEYGGLGRDIIEAISVLEILCKYFMGLGWVYVLSAFYGGENITKLGSPEQKKKLLPDIARGKILVSYGLTEPDAGLDTAACSTIAEHEDGHFLINGHKIFITGAIEADYIIALVRTKREVRREGLSMLLIDLKSPGISIQPIKKLGSHCISLCEVIFEDVKVSEEHILGGPEMLNKGWSQFMATLDVEHIEVAAVGLGLAQGAYEYALKYAKERKQFGKPIGKFQAISHILVDMATEIEASRLLVYNAAYLCQENKNYAIQASMAKYYATETAKRVALNCLQILGGYGYTMELDAQRYVRDSLVLTIGGGTSQIQKNVISRMIGL